MNLDLDNQNTWVSALQELIYAPALWATIEERLKPDDGVEFLSQLTCRAECLKDDVAKYLRESGMTILLAEYKNVVGYHGCRPNKESTYRTTGILPSDIRATIDYARQLFNGIEGFDKAIRDIGHDYLNHNEGKIGLLMSAKAAMNSRNDYTGGSELIRAIANRLGAEAKRRYVITGKPTLIKCFIPIEWLDTYTTCPVRAVYINEVMAALVRMRKWPEEETTGDDAGYLLTRAIPPENILEFIDMTNFNNQHRWTQL